MAEKDLLTRTKDSLKRVQEFDANALVRHEKLGEAFEFSGAVEPAKRLVALFQKLPVETLDFFPENELNQIMGQADSVFGQFDEIISFDPLEADATSRRQSMIKGLETAYQPAFSKLESHIAFSIARTANFSEISSQGHAAVQGIKDEVAALMSDLEETRDSSAAVLEEVRTLAAQRGVSQEAFHFSKQAEHHQKEAAKWQKYTVWTAIGLGAYGIATLFIHKWAFLTPVDVAQSIQLTVSKLLIFGVLSYMLALCAKNFLSHRHNEIVNTHRQNALMTFQSLVNAGSIPESRDIVLQQAASAIYQLHDTGYVKSSESSNSTLVDLLPRASVPISAGGGTHSAS